MVSWTTLCFLGENMIEKEIEKLIENEVHNLGYDYLHVTFMKENGNDVLRVVVDKDSPTSLDEIVKVNEVISPLIDEADLIKGRYMLDVTTLGAEKPLSMDKLSAYVERYIAIHLINPYKGMNNMEGYLKEVNENEIHLEYREKQRKLIAILEKSNIDKIRLAVKL